MAKLQEDIIYYNEQYNVYMTHILEPITNIEEYIKTSLKNNTLIKIYKVPKAPDGI